MLLEGDVFPRDATVLAQVISECQRASFFVSAGLNDVNMMRVRPFTWSMKERAHGIVNMGHVNIAQRGQRRCVDTERLQVFHGHLNVNDPGFASSPGTAVEPWWSMRHASAPSARARRSRSASNSRTQRGSYRRDLQSLGHDRFQPSNFTGLGSLRPFLCEKCRR